jgi:hypothetical protein
MKLPLRTFLRLPASAAALATECRTALALDYPTQPVRLVVRKLMFAALQESGPGTSRT